MKIVKRILSMMMAVITLVSVVSISAEALRVVVYEGNDEQCGYMVPVNSKGTKTVSTAKVYGAYDYLNFLINSPFVQTNYYFYEIYSDKKLTKCVQSGSVKIEDKGDFFYSVKLKLKGKYKSKTYYIVTYAGVIEEYNPETLIIDAESLRQSKLVVDRTTSFSKQKVMLKKTKNTTKGAYIKWSKLSGANKYYIYRRNITGSKWTKVGSVSKSKTSFFDTSIKNKNGNYIYTVKAVNKKGTASRYHYQGLTCLFAKPPVLESVSVIYNNTIEIEWGKTSSSAKYNIMRKEEDGKWKTIKTNCSGTTYKDKTAKPGKKYTYSVKAVLSTDYGKTTSSYYANESKAITLLGAPELNSVAVTETGVKVNWSAVEGVSGYTVLRRPLDKSEGWTELGKVDSTVLEFTDTTADLESAYIYTVRSDGEKTKDSYFSAGIEFVLLDEPEASHQFTENKDGATISWKTVDLANQYNVYVTNEAGEWELYETVNRDSYDEAGYKLNCKYVTDRTGTLKYAVTALRDGANETPVNQVCEMEYFPWTVTTANISVDGMLVYWTDKGAQSYNIYRRTGDENSEYVLIDTVEGIEKSTSMKYVDDSIEDYTAYTYMVKGVYNGVEQTTCYKQSATYSRLPESAITRNEKVTFVEYEYDGEVYFEMPDNETPVEIYGYDYKKNKWVALYTKEAEDPTLIKVASYNLANPNSDGEYTVSIVYNVDGNRTAFDVAPVTAPFCDDEFEGFSGKSTAEGVTLNFDAVEGADKYIFTYTDATAKETKKIVIEANGESSYTIPIDFDVSARDYYYTITMDVVLSDLNIVRHYGSVDVGKKPEIYKGVRNSDGTVTLYWDYYDDWSRDYVVYRQAEGSTKWRKYNDVTGSLTTIKGKKHFRWIDKKAEKGVVYTYKVIAEYNYTPSDPVDFHLHPDSYYETITVK